MHPKILLVKLFLIGDKTFKRRVAFIVRPRCMCLHRLIEPLRSSAASIAALRSFEWVARGAIPPRCGLAAALSDGQASRYRPHRQCPRRTRREKARRAPSCPRRRADVVRRKRHRFAVTTGTDSQPRRARTFAISIEPERRKKTRIGRGADRTSRTECRRLADRSWTQPIRSVGTTVACSRCGPNAVSLCAASRSAASARSPRAAGTPRSRGSDSTGSAYPPD